MRAAVIVLITACGRVGFDPYDGVTKPASPWQGDFTLEEPQPIAGLNTAQRESECFVMPDGLRIYFAVSTAQLPNHDIWTATRADAAAPFANPVRASEISTADIEGRLVSGDGLRGYLWSGRNAANGGSDIWTVARASPSDPFLNANVQVVSGLDGPNAEFDPWPTPNNSRLYFMVTEATMLQQIYVVDLLSPTVATAPRLISTQSVYSDDNPTLSADELFIVFGSTRPEGLGLIDLWYARRPDRDSQFEPAQLLPVVNTAFVDSEPCITEQGELIFSSDRTNGVGNYDLFRSRFIPQ